MLRAPLARISHPVDSKSLSFVVETGCFKPVCRSPRNSLAFAECHQESFGLHALGRRDVVARSDGGRTSPDAGGLLLRETERVTNVIRQVAACFTDHRDPDLIERTVNELVAPVVYAPPLAPVPIARDSPQTPSNRGPPGLRAPLVPRPLPPDLRPPARESPKRRSQRVVRNTG